MWYGLWHSHVSALLNDFNWILIQNFESVWKKFLSINLLTLFFCLLLKLINPLIHFTSHYNKIPFLFQNALFDVFFELLNFHLNFRFTVFLGFFKAFICISLSKIERWFESFRMFPNWLSRNWDILGSTIVRVVKFFLTCFFGLERLFNVNFLWW